MVKKTKEQNTMKNEHNDHQYQQTLVISKDPRFEIQPDFILEDEKKTTMQISNKSLRSLSEFMKRHKIRSKDDAIAKLIELARYEKQEVLSVLFHKSKKIVVFEYESAYLIQRLVTGNTEIQEKSDMFYLNHEDFTVVYNR